MQHHLCTKSRGQWCQNALRIREKRTHKVTSHLWQTFIGYINLCRDQIQSFFKPDTLYSHDHVRNGNGFIMCYFHQFGGSWGSSCQYTWTGFPQNGCCRASSWRTPAAIFSTNSHASALHQIKSLKMIQRERERERERSIFSFSNIKQELTTDSVRRKAATESYSE